MFKKIGRNLLWLATLLATDNRHGSYLPKYGRPWPPFSNIPVNYKHMPAILCCLLCVRSRSINFVIQVVNQILGIFRLVFKEVCPLIYNFFFFSNKCIIWGENSHHFYKHCLDLQKSDMYVAFLARSFQDSLSVFLAIRGKIPSWSTFTYDVRFLGR